MDFNLIAKAGLTQREFAELADVSRATTNLWVRGKMNPHRFIESHVSALLTNIQKGMEAGALPLTQRDHAARIAALQALIQPKESA